VDRRRRAASLQDVPKEFPLNWKTVMAREMPSLQAPLRRLGPPGPQVIGMDQVSIRKRRPSCLVMSGLVRRRPIWLGGNRWLTLRAAEGRIKREFADELVIQANFPPSKLMKWTRQDVLLVLIRSP
jgi:hypothetical protein